jgi:hypothetical protein
MLVDKKLGSKLDLEDLWRSAWIDIDLNFVACALFSS